MHKIIVQVPSHFSHDLKRKDQKIIEHIFYAKSGMMDVSDGYHTMTELYAHRYALFIALVNILDTEVTPLHGKGHICWKSRLHHDGTMFDDECFIAGIQLKYFTDPRPQISYHLPLTYWDKLKCKELPRAPEWDGHTSQDVIRRLGYL